MSDVKDIPPILSVEGLSCVFKLGGDRKVYAVDDVALQVNLHETLGIVGESGCGKSTLARLILKLQRPTAGSIALNGEEIATMSEARFRRRRRAIQAVFQDPNSSLNPRLRVSGTLMEPLHRLRLSRAEKRSRVSASLASVGLPETVLNRHPHEFSGGQRQRLAIARALVAAPDLIVCDEPTSALDVSVQAQVLNLLRDLQDASALSMLFISHNLAAVRQVSDRIAVMYLGQIVEIGPSDAIFSAPQHPYTRTLLDAVPQPVPDQPRHPPVVGEVPSPFHRPPGCAFADRCQHAQPRCRQAPPELTGTEPGRKVRCFYPLSIASSPDRNRHRTVR